MTLLLTLPGHTQSSHRAQSQLQPRFLALLAWVCVALMEMRGPALTWPLAEMRLRPALFTSCTHGSCTVINLYPCKLSKTSSHSNQDVEWSPSRHILTFLGVPLSVLPQQTAVCPHQSSDLSAVSHPSRAGISRCYLPAQVLASSPDLPFSDHPTQEPANLLKTFS